MSLILVTGGARAGKSTFAENLVLSAGGVVYYAATAEAGDEEMAERIKAHRKQRPADWVTIEAPRNVAITLKERIQKSPSTILLDCMTLLASNILLAHGENVAEAWNEIEQEIDGFIAIADTKTMIVVTNEVGLGLVPGNKLSRDYRDLLGRANQKLANAAGRVYFVVSGIPVTIKNDTGK